MKKIPFMTCFLFVFTSCGQPDWRELAEEGDVEAKYELARALNGQGEREEAYEWFRKAAEAGHRRAASVVGREYLDNDNREEAIRWFKMAEDEFYLDLLVNILRLEEFDYRIELQEGRDDRFDLFWKAKVSNNTNRTKRFQLWIYGYDEDDFEVYENIMTPIILELGPGQEELFSTRDFMTQRQYDRTIRFVCRLREL
jgi:tetratricopeptide (TPR) repeat protein